MRLALCAALVALAGCAVVRVPVKVVGTTAGVATKAVGSTIMAVTTDAHHWD
ncbi:hypothetical protein [Palleronia sp. THAF1]|uniref:hypothetical protein n=1 Tax=Palleronia sp. THAF1 TaxID=2587842 RepID=UPI0015626CA6|nr:hypothetical protein [Palleronia sp. THAF1]